jgi:hypothetical protein
MEDCNLMIKAPRILICKSGKLNLFRNLIINKLLIAPFLLLLIIPIWLTFIAPILVAIPTDFSYSADIKSIDTFYDVDRREFSPPISSNSIFSYTVNSKRNNILLIDNLFDVRAADGTSIFTVLRSYAIDSISRKHVKKYADEIRNGYLFAPPGLKKGQSYNYWHVNYNSPAPMKYSGETLIQGLPVYIFEAEYLSDQTLDLLHLPNVNKNVGIELDIKLTQWIEPITGRMVKYEDFTTAYYYNINTGQRLYPWNKFNNQLSADSINEQVRIAQYEKQFFILIKIIVPIIIGIISATILSIGFLSSYFKNDFKQFYPKTK